MALFLLSSTLLTVLMFHGYHTADWTSGPHTGTTQYACTGDDVTIPWAYALAAGDVLDDIQWLYQGQSEEVIAISSHGAFLPLPAFANRVQLVGNGGLKISNVTQADSGNYSVQITAADKANNHINLQKHLTLEIADGLMTSDRQLHVIMNPTAVLDIATNSSFIELQCGHFLFAHHPPFDVQWLTPSGSVQSSSHYKDGQFSFLLPPQDLRGSYTCRVSAHAANTCVARDVEASVVVDTLAARLALIEVMMTAAATERKQLETRLTAADSKGKQLEARLTAADFNRTQLEAWLAAADSKLKQIQAQQITQGNELATANRELTQLEAKLTAAESDRKELEANLTAADSKLKQIQAQQLAQSTQLATANTERTQLEGKLAAQDTKLAAADRERKLMEGRLTAQDTKLAAGNTERTQFQARLTAADSNRKQHEARLNSADTERRQLISDQKLSQSQLHAVTNDIAAIKHRNSLVVSFHAGLSLSAPVSFNTGDHMTLTIVYTNQGNGYNKNTGAFTAPVTGTYCFIASAGTTTVGSWGGLDIIYKGSSVGFAGAFDSNEFEMATAHTVLHLAKGEAVWLKAFASATYWNPATSFSGFLISPDP